MSSRENRKLQQARKHALSMALLGIFLVIDTEPKPVLSQSREDGGRGKIQQQCVEPNSHLPYQEVSDNV